MTVHSASTPAARLRAAGHPPSKRPEVAALDLKIKAAEQRLDGLQQAIVRKGSPLPAEGAPLPRDMEQLGEAIDILSTQRRKLA